MSTEYRDYNYDENVNEVLLGELNEDKVAQPLLADDTKFTSAAISSTTVIAVTLADAGGYGAVAAEWGIKINKAPFIDMFLIDTVTGEGTTIFTFTAKDVLFAAGDVVVVSHLYKASGVDKFIDQPVTNNLV